MDCLSRRLGAILLARLRVYDSHPGSVFRSIILRARSKSNNVLLRDLLKFQNKLVMDRVYLSGYKKRKLAQTNREKIEESTKANPKVTDFFNHLMITNCSAERSFSQLKFIKNPKRSTMRQERLDSLSLLCIESDILRRITFEDVIDEFARQKSRLRQF